MLSVKLDTDEAAADEPCGPWTRRAAKGIKDKAGRLADGGDQGFERLRRPWYRTWFLLEAHSKSTTRKRGRLRAAGQFPSGRRSGRDPSGAPIGQRGRFNG